MADTASEQVQNRPPVSDQQHSDSEDAPGQADLVSLLQRERADFANYRRRAAQDRAEEGDRARANQLVALLPILDDLDRAFAQTPDELRDHPWIRGIVLGQNRLLEFLAMSGVEPFGAEGDPFDPASHEALFFEERPGLDDRQVATVIRPGYRTATRVLRPAHVGVAGPPDASGGATDNRPTDDA